MPYTQPKVSFAVTRSSSPTNNILLPLFEKPYHQKCKTFGYFRYIYLITKLRCPYGFFQQENFFLFCCCFYIHLLHKAVQTAKDPVQAAVFILHMTTRWCHVFWGRRKKRLHPPTPYSKQRSLADEWSKNGRLERMLHGQEKPWVKNYSSTKTVSVPSDFFLN